jgi:hypothetical protein
MQHWLELLLQKYFRWTVAVVMLIVVGVGYSVFISAKVSSIQTITAAERDKANKDLVDQKALREALKVSLAKYKTIFTEPNLEKINGVLPEKPEFPSILLTLQNIAASAGYSLDSMSVSPVAVASTGAQAAPTVSTTPGIISQLSSVPNLGAYDLTISVTGPGGYAGFKKLISAFESSRQLFDVLSLSYTAAVENVKGTGSSTPSFALTVRTYSFTTPAAK